MIVTEDMVRVAAKAICSSLFGPFIESELDASTSPSSQSMVAARAALEAALAAMENPAWQIIGAKASIDYPGTNLTTSKAVVELWKSAGASVRPLYALPSPPSTNKEDGK